MSKWLVLFDPQIIAGTALVVGIVLAVVGDILTETGGTAARWWQTLPQEIDV